MGLNFWQRDGYVAAGWSRLRQLWLTEGAAHLALEDDIECVALLALLEDAVPLGERRL